MYRVELKVKSFFASSFVISSFLMYRVELKEGTLCEGKDRPAVVPNVPCGVERKAGATMRDDKGRLVFLMYRVELKVFCFSLN